MMTTLTFDTLSVSQELVTGGFSEKQAEAVTSAIRTAQDAHLEDLATKGDIAGVKSEIAEVKAEIALSRKDTIITLGSLMIGLIGLLVAYLELRGSP